MRFFRVLDFSRKKHDYTNKKETVEITFFADFSLKKQRRPPIIKDDKDVKDGDVEISWDMPSDNQTWLN